MASRKNRSGKSNRRSPRRHARVFERLQAWFAAHRRPAIVAGCVALLLASLFVGYLLAARFATLSSVEPKYARIDDIPDLPKYEESDPAQPVTTIEERPRAAVPAPAAAPDVQWRRNAVPFADLRTRPLIVIVIDDMGLDRPRSRRAWELPGPMTMSFLPYARELRDQARTARARGHEIMLHLPMEPTGRADPGPGALRVAMTEIEIGRAAAAALDGYDGYVGVNNHMGSRFTAYRPGMTTVLQQVRARSLLFLDSRTTPQTVGDQLAQELGVPSIARHVFLDDDEAPAAVRARLAETERLARRQGFVVAIGHPHEATLQALAEWLPTLSAKGLALAPATAALRRRNGWD